MRVLIAILPDDLPPLEDSLFDRALVDEDGVVERADHDAIFVGGPGEVHNVLTARVEEFDGEVFFGFDGVPECFRCFVTRTTRTRNYRCRSRNRTFGGCGIVVLERGGNGVDDERAPITGTGEMRPPRREGDGIDGPLVSRQCGHVLNGRRGEGEDSGFLGGRLSRAPGPRWGGGAVAVTVAVAFLGRWMGCLVVRGGEFDFPNVNLIGVSRRGEDVV